MNPKMWWSPRPRIEERHEVVVNRVAYVQAEDAGVEVRHHGRLRGEQQRVPEPARIHIPGDLAPRGPGADGRSSWTN